MRPVFLGGRLCTVIALLALVVACDKDPHESESSTIPTVPTTPTGAATVSRIEVNGPGQLAPGQSAQYTVIAHMSDSTSMVPTAVRWIASPPGILQVDQSGNATGGGVGGAAVTAEVAVAGALFGTVQGSKGVIILQEGTFLMVGTVSDGEFSSARLENALVEVMPGSHSATTNADGFYRIYGVTPGAEARVTRPGYEPLVQPIALTSNGTQNFGLTASGPRLSLSGSYTLNIDAADGCSALPEDLRHRRYDVVLTQTGLTVDVMLTEPRFLLIGGRGNRFSGRVEGSAVTFTLRSYVPSWDWGIVPIFPDVAERLPNGTFLVPHGTAFGTESADGIVGTLNGGLSNFDARFPDDGIEMGYCFGKQRFALTRR